MGGNTVRLLPHYPDTIATMAAEVATAERSVDVQFYITAWDDVTGPVFRELAAAAERGVRVRMLFDHLGSRGIPGYQEMLKKLDGTGIEWHTMLPIQPLKGRFRRPDLRNHRKLLVVDGAVGFTGSLNLTEPGYNKPKNHELGREWVELMVRLEGPVVAALAAVFAQDWFAETEEVSTVALTAAPPPEPGSTSLHDIACQLVPSGPGYVAENNLRLFTSLIYGATRRISLTSPYFVPDESLLYAVTTAAQRGIDIELFVSELSDQFMVGHAQASYYQALLKAGVRIYLYPAPYILHSKHFTIDDDVAVLGSSNMDMRSFALNYEISLMLLGSDVVAAMREVEDTYRSLSRELTLEEWSGRSGRERYVDTVMRLTAALQ
jgi:cardiolipin synthase